MKDAPAFDFYAQRWLAGTMDMTAEERGAYINLLCRQWEDDGLDDDPKRLAAVARCRPATLTTVLSRFPVGEDGKRRNPRLEITRQEQRARITKSREKIEKMNAARNSCRASTRRTNPLFVEPLVEPLQDPPHHSPLTTHPSTLLSGALSENRTSPDETAQPRRAPAPDFADPDMVAADAAMKVVRSYPGNGNRYEAQAAVLRAVAAGETLESIAEKVTVHAAKYAALPQRDRQFCPGLATYFAEARWLDDPNGSPWTRHAPLTREQEAAQAAKGAPAKFVASIPRAPAMQPVPDEDRASAADFRALKQELQPPPATCSTML